MRVIICFLLMFLFNSCYLPIWTTFEKYIYLDTPYKEDRYPILIDNDKVIVQSLDVVEDGGWYGENFSNTLSFVVYLDKKNYYCYVASFKVLFVFFNQEQIEQVKLYEVNNVSIEKRKIRGIDMYEYKYEMKGNEKNKFLRKGKLREKINMLVELKLTESEEFIDDTLTIQKTFLMKKINHRDFWYFNGSLAH